VIAEEVDQPAAVLALDRLRGCEHVDEGGWAPELARESPDEVEERLERLDPRLVADERAARREQFRGDLVGEFAREREAA
jgi:hypothetical protein